MKRAKKLVTLLAIASLTLGTIAPVFAADEPAAVTTVTTVAASAKSGIFTEKAYYYQGVYNLGKYPVVNKMDALNKKIEDFLFKTALFKMPASPTNYLRPNTLPVSYKIEELEGFAKLTVYFNVVTGSGYAKGEAAEAVYFIDVKTLTETTAAKFDEAVKAAGTPETPSDEGAGAPEESGESAGAPADTEVTMLPLRSSLTPLGFEITWNEATQSVVVLHSKVECAKIFVDKNEYIVDGETFELSAAPILEDGVMFCPQDFFEEILGLIVTGFDDGSYVLSVPPTEE